MIRPSQTIMILAVTCVFAINVQESIAEQGWYDYSLRLFAGQVNTPATIYGHDTYKKLQMGNEMEQGIGYTTIISPTFDFDVALSQINATGIQHNRTGSGNEDNSLRIGMKIDNLFLTGRWHANAEGKQIYPWLGIGANGSLVNINEYETIATTGGSITKPGLSSVSSTIGAHFVAGINIYPKKNSALSVAIEARYNLMLLESGPFDGETSGFAFLVGIKWDFMPQTL